MASGTVSILIILFIPSVSLAQTAQTAPTAPSVSASASADKGGRQVVEIDGKKMTFAEIAALPKEQKDAILINKLIMRPSKREAYDEYELQVANQEADTAAAKKQVANQE